MVDPHTVPVFTLNNGLTIPAIGMGTFGSDRVTPDEVAGAVAGAYYGVPDNIREKVYTYIPKEFSNVIKRLEKLLKKDGH